MEEEYLGWLQADPRNVWTDILQEEMRTLHSLTNDVRVSREHEAMWRERGWHEHVTAEQAYRRRVMRDIKEQRERISKLKWQMKKQQAQS